MGGAIALALDLSLRDRTENRLSLDDFMQLMWRKYGRPGGSREGYVDHPYTIADAEETLAEVSGDRAFARDFFSRYVQGHDVRRLPSPARTRGLHRPSREAQDVRGSATCGSNRGAASTSPRSSRLPGRCTPPGVDQDDELQQVDGQRIGGDGDIASIMQRHKPGDRVTVVFTDRTRAPKTATIHAGRRPHVEVVPVESAGALTVAQQTFRSRWLGSK